MSDSQTGIKPPHVLEKEKNQVKKVFNPNEVPDLMDTEFDDTLPVLNAVLSLQEEDHFIHQMRRAKAQGIEVVEVDRRIIQHYCGTGYKGLYFDMQGIRLYEKGKMAEAIKQDERRVEGFGSPSNT